MTALIAFDVGGTTTSAMMYQPKTKMVLYKKTKKTVVGKDAFPVFFNQMIQHIQAQAKSLNIWLEKTILVALPGAFKPGVDIVVQKGSAKQLVHEDESLDDQNIKDWLCPHYPLFFVNDAQAQGLGAMLDLWQPHWQSKLLGYIGPGTGLGGAFVQFKKTKNDWTWVTNGHIFDSWVTLRSKKIIAEDVLSGRGVLEALGISAKTYNQQLASNQVKPTFLRDMGHVCQLILSQIKDARIQKKYESVLESDQNTLKALSTVILGGSLGRKGVIGDYLKQSIEAMGLGVVQIQDPIQHVCTGLVNAYYRFEPLARV